MFHISLLFQERSEVALMRKSLSQKCQCPRSKRLLSVALTPPPHFLASKMALLDLKGSWTAKVVTKKPGQLKPYLPILPQAIDTALGSLPNLKNQLQRSKRALPIPLLPPPPLRFMGKSLGGLQPLGNRWALVPLLTVYIPFPRPS